MLSVIPRARKCLCCKTWALWSWTGPLCVWNQSWKRKPGNAKWIQSFHLVARHRSVLPVGVSYFHTQQDRSWDLSLMLNTGQSRGGLSFRKRLHRIIQNTTLLPLVLNKLQDWLFTNQTRSTEVVFTHWRKMIFTSLYTNPLPSPSGCRGEEREGEKLLRS